jgi:hypothetical protein
MQLPKNERYLEDHKRAWIGANACSRFEFIVEGPVRFGSAGMLPTFQFFFN